MGRRYGEPLTLPQRENTTLGKQEDSSLEREGKSVDEQRCCNLQKKVHYKSTRREQRQGGSQDGGRDRNDLLIPLILAQSQTPQSSLDQPTRFDESEVTTKNQLSMKGLQAITAMKNLSEGKKLPRQA